LATVREHLKPGGVFLFDFWYGPGVLSDPPKTAVRRFATPELDLTRLAEPLVHAGRNVVDVGYTLFVQDNASGEIRRINETHSMRYLFQPELREMLMAEGFQPACCYRWMTREEPGLDCWNAVMAAVRT